MACSSAPKETPAHERLIHAAFLFNISAAQECLADKSLNINGTNLQGKTALHVICQKINPFNETNDPIRINWVLHERFRIKIIQEILAHKELDINKKSPQGNTALHYACTTNQFRPVELLLKHENINPNITNNSGDTPLHLAIKWTPATITIIPAIILALTNHKKITINIPSEEENSPLHTAALFGNLSIFNHLLTQNAEINLEQTENPFETLLKHHPEDPWPEKLFQETCDLVKKSCGTHSDLLTKTDKLIFDFKKNLTDLTTSAAPAQTPCHLNKYPFLKKPSLNSTATLPPRAPGTSNFETIAKNLPKTLLDTKIVAKHFI